MSYHIIHLRSHGSSLLKKRGRLILKYQGVDDNENATSERSIALEDIHAVIVAAKGVYISPAVFSALLAQGSIILHCNQHYAPIGMSLPLPKTINKDCVATQLDRPKVLNKRIWKKILYQKIHNQACVLDALGSKEHQLWIHLKRTSLDEGNSARHYWSHFFPKIGVGKMNRDRTLSTPPNMMLNYGYTVLTTLCHQALIAHGLLCQLGVCHVTRYRADPLVYDFVEPFRAYVDISLAEYYLRTEAPHMDGWCKSIGRKLKDIRVEHPRYSLKLINAIDKSASSLAKAYSKLKIEDLWLPSISRDKLNRDTTPR